MGSLNPEWLAIELDSIDATAKNWSSAIRASYKAAVDAAYAKGAQKQRQSLSTELAEAQVEEKRA